MSQWIPNIPTLHTDDVILNAMVNKDYKIWYYFWNMQCAAFKAEGETPKAKSLFYILKWWIICLSMKGLVPERGNTWRKTASKLSIFIASSSGHQVFLKTHWTLFTCRLFLKSAKLHSVLCLHKLYWGFKCKHVLAKMSLSFRQYIFQVIMMSHK